MNRRERDDLLKFLAPLLRARATDKDLAAETLILEQCARQPDALYLLVQRAMALESALQAAHERLAHYAGTVDATADTQDQAGPITQPSGTPGDRTGAWGPSLLAQAGALGAGVGLGAAVGVAAGVVAGGLLLDALEDGFMDDA